MTVNGQISVFLCSSVEFTKGIFQSYQSWVLQNKSHPPEIFHTSGALLKTTTGFCDKQLYGELFIRSAEFILSVQQSKCVCHWYGKDPDLMLQLLVTILTHSNLPSSYCAGYCCDIW